MMPHAEMCRLSDLTAASPSSLDGRTVRTVGKVLTYDPNTCVALLTEPKPPSQTSPSSLRVLTHLVDAENFLAGSTVMVIGELEEDLSHVEEVLDNMDLEPDLFDQTMEETSTASIQHNSLDDETASVEHKGLEEAKNESVEQEQGLCCRESGNGKPTLNIFLKARASSCADRLDYELYLRSLDVMKDLTLDL